MKKAKRSLKIALKLSKRFKCGLPQAYCLSGIYWWLKNKPSIAIKWLEKSLKASKQLGARYYLGNIHFEMGKRMNDRSHLEAARSIFAELNAKADLKQANESINNLE